MRVAPQVPTEARDRNPAGQGVILAGSSQDGVSKCLLPSYSFPQVPSVDINLIGSQLPKEMRLSESQLLNYDADYRSMDVLRNKVS